jgi:formylglycine-generating enzyme required for sulfatase activity/tRNA A-37 threonylcarbamoyl transferase component Bud32/succinate dehydrogenase flavin-adding protein (antitoxin of CptAB toxin-antitoxin module)
LGKEQTLVGQPPPAPAPVAPTAPGGSWLGQEKTIVPASKAPTEPPKEAWLGQEKTMVGFSPATAPTEVKPVEEWLGREATMLGMPAGQGGGAKSGATPTPASKKTSPTLEDGWHLKGRQGPLTGQNMGDYEIGGILGEGGMGIVYRARQISLKRRVALKVLPPALANDQRLRQRFEQEARTASLINSPHVVQVFAAGSFNDNVFFVMEFVEGTDLGEIIHQKQDAKTPFSPDEAAGYIIQAARGLAEAGKLGIVHRDIKPPNLMVTGKGLVKIADFGISKLAGEHSLTMTGTAVGTPAYVSPEQGRGDPVDNRSDIYSLGVVFYELLTGQKPFDGSTANALIYQHNYTEPKLLTEIRPDIPEPFQAVALKCMQKDPAKRYQDAAELVSDLERVRAGSAPMTALMGAFGTGADEAMRRLGIKQRRLWPYLAAAAVLIIGVGLALFWYLGQSEARQTLAKDISEKRDKLVVLDKSQPVPQGCRDDLTRLAELVAADDADLVRWNTKLAQVENYKTRLARLDAGDLPQAALRLEATADLDRYKELVGSGGEDVARWQGKLDAARDAIVRLREGLSELDKTVVVPVAMDERLDPQLRQLSALAGEGDDDVKRWTQKLADGRGRMGQLRLRLAMLDDAKEVITESRINQLDSDLTALRAIVGEQDAGVVTWGGKLQAARDHLARLRKNLARLDPVEWATADLQAALKQDLATYTTLVEANDPELKKWTGKFNESVQRIAGLRKSLARLDQPEALSLSEQEGFAETLTSFRALVSPDDGQLQAWTARLRVEKESVATLREILKRLEREDRLTLVELESCDKALAQLDRLGGIAEDQKQLMARRLSEERQKLEDLRQFLRSRDGTEIVIDQELVDRINLLSRLAGEQDVDVKRWRGRVAEYERLRAELLPLDQVAPIPDRADVNLTSFTAIVGEANPEVRKWGAKLARVTALRRALASLDRIVPLPEGAEVNAKALVAEVGANEPEAKRWLAKAQRVIELTGALDRSLAGAYVLPAEAPRQSAELVGLVGLEDKHVARLAQRTAVLVGPGKPAWASAFGRDQYGLWAELTFKGVTQRFRFVPCGQFLMGSSEGELGRDADEPLVPVTLTRCYWLADSECMQGLWDALMAADPSRFRGPERPVERVSWDDCQGFLARLNASVADLNARLPTEAEWEYACRAGVAGMFMDQQGPVPLTKIDTVAWFEVNAGRSTKEIKRHQPNRLGLFDMHGNVWEWCHDRYGTYSPTPVVDPVGRQEETRVARGGSWADPALKCRAANRLAVRADMRTLYIGFRLLAAVVWPEGKDPTAEMPVSAASVPVVNVAQGAGAAPR